MNKYEISKVYYKETQKNGGKHVLFGPGNSCSKNFVNFQGTQPYGGAFLNKSAGYLTLPRNDFLGYL